MNKDQSVLFAGFESEILNIIDNSEEITRGDLQGMVAALVQKIYNAGADSQLI
jgi:hypothetical protein